MLSASRPQSVILTIPEGWSRGDDREITHCRLDPGRNTVTVEES
ncbi:hypothetical protein [Haladaptatus sp. W1]|nr:hypothetical protein [Haladaptatus sp. W1]